MQHILTSLLAQFMPISDLTSRWIAHFLPVIQCSSSAIWSELKTSNYFIFSDTIPVEQHQLEWNSIEILSCAFCGWNVKCKAFVENGTERSLLHVSLLLRNSLSLEWEKSWNGKTWIFLFSLSWTSFKRQLRSSRYFYTLEDVKSYGTQFDIWFRDFFFITRLTL